MESYYFKPPPINCVNVITQTALKGNPQRHWGRFDFFFSCLFQRILYVRSVTKAGLKSWERNSFFSLLNIQNYTYPADTETLSITLWFLQKNKASSGKYKAKVQCRHHWQNQVIYIEYTEEMHTVVVRQADATIRLFIFQEYCRSIQAKKKQHQVERPHIM